MKQIPRLLGPTMHKLGKFPTLLERTESITDKIDDIRRNVKFQLKKVLTIGVAVANVELSEQQIYANVQIAVNFLVSLLKKNWQNIKTLHVKSTMGGSTVAAATGLLSACPACLPYPALSVVTKAGVFRHHSLAQNFSIRQLLIDFETHF